MFVYVLLMAMLPLYQESRVLLESEWLTELKMSVI